MQGKHEGKTQKSDVGSDCLLKKKNTMLKLCLFHLSLNFPRPHLCVCVRVRVYAMCIQQRGKHEERRLKQPIAHAAK